MKTRIKQYAFAADAAYPVVTPVTLLASHVKLEVEELNGVYTREQHERQPLRRTLSRKKTIPSRSSLEITGRFELIGGGGPTTAVVWEDVLRSCGTTAQKVFNSYDLTGAPAGTFTPGEKVTAAPSGAVLRYFKMLDTDTMAAVVISGAVADGDTLTGSKSAATGTVQTPSGTTQIGWGYQPQDPDDSISLTCAVLEDGNIKKGWGARTNAQINVEAARPAFLSFTNRAAALVPAAQALFTGITLPTVDPEIFVEAGLTVGTDALCVESFSFDFGNNVVADLCANLLTSLGYGIRGFRITERAPTIQINPEAEPESTIAFFQKYDQATQFGFVATMGYTAGQRIGIAAPSAQYEGLPVGDREGVLTYDATLRLNNSEDDGDDEWLIVTF